VNSNHTPILINSSDFLDEAIFSEWDNFVENPYAPKALKDVI